VKLLQNQSLEPSHLPLYLLEKSFENFLEIVSGRSNVPIISKCQSSLSNKFYDRYQRLQVEAISDIFRID